MADDLDWGPPTQENLTARATAPMPTAPPITVEPTSGLTADVMHQLEGGRPVTARSRITNTSTFVLLGLVGLVGAFSLGAWLGRNNAPTTTPATSFAAVGGFGGATGASGRSGRSGFVSGATGGFPAASGAGGLPAGAGAGGGGFGGAGATAGTVKLVDGPNIYITTSTGTIVKVITNAQSQVSLTKQGSAADLAVGESVVVQGDTAADGTITATVVRTGLAGAGGGFGARGGGATGASGAAASGATAGR